MIRKETEFYTISDVKKILTLSSQTIRKLLKKRELLGFQSGNKWVISKKSIENYIEKHSNEETNN